MSESPVLSVHVDEERCRGHARCLDIAPDAFLYLDDEDRTVAVEEGVRSTDLAVLREVVAACPERAITIHSSGETEG